jgi:hypothetical protein
MEDSSIVVHLILKLLHMARRYLAIASNVSEVRSKASVGLFETLVARLDTQLLLYVELVPVVVDPVVFVGGKAYIAACSGPIAAMVVFLCFGRLRETRRRKLNFSKVTHTPAREA